MHRSFLLSVAMAIWLASADQALGLQTCPTPEYRAELAELANRDNQDGPEQHRQRWQALVAAHQACGDVAAETAALGLWSDQLLRRMARDEALAIENTRYALAVRAGLDRQRAESAARLGKALSDRGELDLAERRLREASDIFEQLGAWAEAADAQSRLSRFKRMAGDYLGALTDEQAALNFRRHIDPPPNVWRSLLNLAVLYEQLELPEDARRRYAESLDEAEREGNEANVAIVLAGFSGFLNDFGAADAVQALAMAERSLDIVKRNGDIVQISSGLLQVGRAQMNLRHLDSAERALGQALENAVSAAHKSMQAHILLRYGELAQLQGMPKLALERVHASRVLYESMSNRHRLVKVHALLEEIYQSIGDSLSAAQSGRERFRLRDELIGAKATGKLGELLSRFELGEERRRSELLSQEKAVAELKLHAESQQLKLIYLIAAAIGVALLLLGWRHVTARRLYRLLHEQNQVVLAQAAQLRQANQQLTEQSERLYRASITDGLTGVNNRAQGMQRLHDLVQASAAGRRLAVILIDVDLFKSINDNHGHPVGDQVLVTVARVLQQALPEGAELSRVGGEEFMVLIPDADQRQLFDIGNALRAQVRAATVEVAGQRIGVTISVGVCAVGDLPHASAHQAYAAADDALYRAKRGGRDCVCIHARTEVDAQTEG
jgi:diguanylate cyclase (GGDEF)-like protein